MFKLNTLRIHIILSISVIYINSYGSPVDDLWSKYNKEKLTTTKVDLLLRIAHEYQNEKQLNIADSIYELAIQTAEFSSNDTLLAFAYKSYFDNDAVYKSDNAEEYAKSFTTLATKLAKNDLLYHAYVAGANVALKSNDTKTALEKINRAYYYAGLSNDDLLKIDCFLIWGECLELTNNKIDAFRNFLNAQYLAQKNKNVQLLFECYRRLSYFYLLIENYERARDYAIKQVSLLHETGVTDSSAYMNLLCELSEKYYYNNEPLNADKTNKIVIAFATLHHDRELQLQIFDNYKTYLSRNGLFKQLSDFYSKEHPEELLKLAKNDTISYYRIRGYICEENGRIDSAMIYFKDAEVKILERKSSQKIYVSNFYKRYSQFLLRTGNVALAKAKMDSSYQYALRADYLPYLIETSHYMDSLNYADGHLKEAYEYSTLNKEYTRRQEAAVKQDALLLMEIDNETRQRELIAEQEAKETERRHNIQYTAIIFTIISAFIILIMLGAFKVPKFLIRSMGFVSFIFFFEFIILLLDHKIMEITHHEPWKMLGIKVVIISFMLPFHHWLEHKVTHYLIEHHLVDAEWINSRKFWRKKPKPAAKPEAELPDNSEL
ncbi:MAG: hypothetical protein JST82_03135 [Bacteroidetes bacterium]|nr:hypothetical protein [Bacteroidota bacterium]